MNFLRIAATAAGLLLASTVHAQAPSGAPAGTTGMCKDGTYSNAASKRGACAGHKGVKDWYATDEKPATPAASPASPPSASAGAPVPSSTPAPAATKKAAPATASTTPAAGGGAGQVWVNTSTKVYHCQGDRYYGKTKAGEYMTESAAQAAGDHAARGKGCA